MAALLKNDRPGVRFAATDLVRNLLMSPFMDRSLLRQNMFILNQYKASRYGLNIQFRTLEEQEEVYKTYWQEALGRTIILLVAGTVIRRFLPPSQ